MYTVGPQHPQIPASKPKYCFPSTVDVKPMVMESLLYWLKKIIPYKLESGLQALKKNKE